MEERGRVVAGSALHHGIEKLFLWQREILVPVLGLVVVEVLPLVDHVEVVICSQLLPDVGNTSVSVQVRVEAVIPQMLRYCYHPEVFVHACNVY